MNKLKKYIDLHFPDELKLIIFLSKDKIDGNNQLTNLDNINWKEFLRLVRKHRLSSHVLRHSEYLAEHLPISVYEKLMKTRIEKSRESLSYAIHAIRIFEKFQEQNISHCFFKGPLLSLELYQDIGYRNFGDIDILVQQKDVEQAKKIIEDLDFDCIYPHIEFTEKQKKINYKLSHHYHFKHPQQNIDIELHWKLSNPKSYFGKETDDILSQQRNLPVSKFELPYISNVDNLVYQAAHGSIHQWYRLFWLKDFSVLLQKSSDNDIKKAFELAKKLKLQKCFAQACFLASIVYEASFPGLDLQPNKYLLSTPLHAIATTDLGRKGVFGKIKFVFYRLRLKSDLRYYFELIYRLRTHLSDWEILKLPNRMFFLYYILRPFLLIYKFTFRKKN